MNITILGCGYVGTAVAHLWKQQGLIVTATTTTPTRLPELETIAHYARVVQGNDAAALRALLADQQVVLVAIGSRGPATYEETYVGTAKTLVKILGQTAVQQVIYTSSYSVYGQQQGAWVTEETPVVPTSRNGEILAETEQIFLDAASSAPNLAVCILRLGGIYGPNRELGKILGRSAGTTRPGDGSEFSNWIHLDDIVGAIEFARAHRLQGIYNLVQDGTLPIRDLLDQVLTEHHLPAVTWDASQPSNRAANVRVSNQKLKAAGYRFGRSVIRD